MLSGSARFALAMTVTACFTDSEPPYFRGTDNAATMGDTASNDAESSDSITTSNNTMESASVGASTDGTSSGEPDSDTRDAATDDSSAPNDTAESEDSGDALVDCASLTDSESGEFDYGLYAVPTALYFGEAIKFVFSTQISLQRGRVRLFDRTRPKEEFEFAPTTLDFCPGGIEMPSQATHGGAATGGHYCAVLEIEGGTGEFHRVTAVELTFSVNQGPGRSCEGARMLAPECAATWDPLNCTY